MHAGIQLTNKEECTVQAENVLFLMLRARNGQSTLFSPHESASSHQKTDILHTHAHAELFACLQGAIHLQTARGILVLQPGDLAIAAPGFLHTKLNDTQPTRCCVLDFSCSLKKRAGAADLMRDLSVLLQPGVLSICRGQHALCEELADIAASEESSKYYLPALRLVTVLAKMCVLPLERIGEHETPDTALSSAEPCKDINRLDRLSNLLTAYFMTDLTVERAAELLFISTRQLERIMQKEYGASFHRALCDQRISAAEQMLGDRSLSIAQIANTVGFSSRTAFCRAFEKRHGISPAAFRKEHFETEY